MTASRFICFYPVRQTDTYSNLNAKSPRIAEIAVVKAVQESKGRNAVESGRHHRHSHSRYAMVESESGYLHPNHVNREGTAVCAAHPRTALRTTWTRGLSFCKLQSARGISRAPRFLGLQCNLD